MKLYLNNTSPFARWVLVCGLEYVIPTLELVWVDPWATPANLTRVNPFSTVPVLQLDQGEALYESSSIVRYLIPTAAPSLRELQRLALGKMLLETAFRHVSLKRNSLIDGPPHPLIEQTYQGLTRVLQGLSTENLPSFAPTEIPDIASLQLSVGLDYIAFRCPDLLTACADRSLQERLLMYQSRPSFALTTSLALTAQPAELSLTPF
ncbi:MAG: glutathione S-transferase N-terminal domain-containing protein [Leptolyngbya sp. Prado105]|jgi:glutathione S-transferase|nr:glutathione S-transferase N-terminal domain-containing protein [Leptolyngbya sp. Prado105]